MSNDITFCTNTECPKKEGCERFKDKDFEFSWVARFEPDADGVCEFEIKKNMGVSPEAIDLAESRAPLLNSPPGTPG